MADISSQVPSWLENIAKPADTSTMAKDVGIAFGGFADAIEQHEKAKEQYQKDPESFYKRVKEGLTTARENQVDPLWKLKAEQAKANLTTSWANAEFNYAKLREYNDDQAAWAIEAPKVAQLQAMNPDQREEALSSGNYTFKSPKGMAMLGQMQKSDETYRWRKWQNELRQNQLDNTRTRNEAIATDAKGFSDAYAALTSDDRAQVDAIKGGYDPKSGLFSPQARAKISELRIAEGKPAVGEKEEKPKSPLGKLWDDYQAGKMTDEQYAAEVAKLTAAPKTAATKPSEADSAKIAGLKKAITKFQDSLEEKPEDQDAASKPGSITAKLRQANYDLKALEAKMKPKAATTPAPSKASANTADKAPELPADRKKGTPYLLPNGQTGIWSGTGWLVNQ